MNDIETAIKDFIYNLKVNDFVYGWNDVRRYRVLYVDNRFVIIKKGFNYSIIDKSDMTMGGGDKYQFGNYVTDDLFKVGLIDEPFKEYVKMREDIKWDIVSRKYSVFDEQINLVRNIIKGDK